MQIYGIAKMLYWNSSVLIPTWVITNVIIVALCLNANRAPPRTRNTRDWNTSVNTVVADVSCRHVVVLRCNNICTFKSRLLRHVGIRGAMVARLTPDQKVACSIHVGFNTPNYYPSKVFTFRVSVHEVYELAVFTLAHRF